MNDDAWLQTLRKGTAVITGATGTLGRALAHALAEHRFALVVIGRNEVSLLELVDDLRSHEGASAEPLVCDLADGAALATLPERLRQVLSGSPVSVLVHCAGADSASMTSRDITRDLNVNLHAAKCLTQLAMEDMQSRSAGQIILLGSNMALHAGRHPTGYNRGKAGLEQLAREAIARNETDGVHVLTVIPGLIDSPLLRAGLAERPAWQRPLLKPRCTAGELAREILENGLGRSGLIVMDLRHRIFRRLAGMFPGLLS